MSSRAIWNIRRLPNLVLALVLCTGSLVATADEPMSESDSDHAKAASEPAPSASAAFERLKTLAGTWDGSAQGEGAEGEESFPVQHEFEVSANGTVIMETMNPDTEHEMINMYHLDGEDLVMTHYCAGGNQPTMRLDPAASHADDYVFSFTGGTNLDPAVDQHIHAGELVFVDENRIESLWIPYAAGEQVGKMTFKLERAGS